MRKIFTWVISILFCSVIAIAAREVVTDILSLKASSLPSTCQNGQVRFDTSTNILNKCLSNAWNPVVETTTAQTISNKTFSDAPILAEIATPSTPSGGYGKTYFKSDGKLYTLNDAGTETEVGAGGASGINYIDNPSAESDTSGWATYADAAGTSPVDGTAGSPTTTWTRSTSSPLRDTGSFLLTKDASNRQGEGASYDFTIDASDKGKVIQGSLEYAVSSGTFADDDVSIWIYDVTNATLIQPAPYKLKNHSLPSERFSFEFQSAIDSTSYRLIIHVASTSAVAYVLKFDNFSVGPGAKLYGSAVTDWVSFTPTGSWVTNTTYTGKWRRVGDSMEVKVQAALTGAPNATSFTVNLPPGYSIDTSKQASSSSEYTRGWATVVDSSSGANYTGLTVYQSSTTVVGVRLSDSSGAYSAGTNGLVHNDPITFASGDSVYIKFIVPILGWSSSQIMSHDADTRVVAARLIRTSSQTFTTNASAEQVLWQSTTEDTHNGFSSGDSSYEVKVSGYYLISLNLEISGANILNARYFSIVKTGTSYGSAVELLRIAEITPSAGGYTKLNGTSEAYLTVGTKIYVDVYGAGNNSVNTYTSGGSSSRDSISIVRLSGPSQIMASEHISASYTNSAGTAITTPAAIIPFGNKLHDTHGAYNSGTGVWMAPRSMKVMARISARTAAASYTSGNVVSFSIEKNLSGTFYVMGRAYAYTTASLELSVYGTSPILEVVAGDTLRVYGFSSVATTLNVSGSENTLSIFEVK